MFHKTRQKNDCMFWLGKIGSPFSKADGKTLKHCYRNTIPLICVTSQKKTQTVVKSCLHLFIITIKKMHGTQSDSSLVKFKHNLSKHFQCFA